MSRLDRILILALLPLAGLGLAGAGPIGVNASDGFEKFVDALPIPPVIQVRSSRAELTVTIDQFQMRFHRDLPPGPAWGYDGSSPGPTIVVERGTKLRIHWKSRLPTNHIFKLPADSCP